MYRLVPILAASLLLAGCGGSSSEDSGQASGAAKQTVQLSEQEFSISPSAVNLSATGTYEFQVKNDGKVTHSLEIEGNGVEEEIEDIGPGETKKLKVVLSSEGSYDLYCPIDGHRGKGMEGTITVVGSASGGSGGGGTTTDDMGGTSTGQTGTGADKGSDSPGY